MSLQLLQRVKMLVTLKRGQDVISGYKAVKVSLQFLQGTQDVITVATWGSRCHYSCYKGSLTRGQDAISCYSGVKMSLQLLHGGQDVTTVATNGQDASYTYKGSRCHYSCYKGSRC